jgi:NAD(P)-dependent dehydrogenase (short-subunit alcohol dehydrogenase family)
MKTIASLFDLEGKCAVVTGASAGLGVTLAEGLAAAGARVAVVARREEKLAEVAERIRGHGGEAVPIGCNVAKVDQVEGMVAQAEEKLGGLDIMVCNAGIVAEVGMVPEKVLPKSFETTVKVNLLGLWYCCQAAGARMLEKGTGGSIINITSAEGMGGEQDGPSAYQATKAAVINLTRNLAVSWADRKVRVNAIAPGWFPSEMTGPVFANPEFKAHYEKQTPMGRTGDPSELIGPLLLLASDAGSFITGHNLVVDGGLTATFGMIPRPEAFVELAANLVPDGRGRRIEPS